jgi:hypothetical protein
MITTASREQGGKSTRSRSPLLRPFLLRGGKDGTAMDSAGAGGEGGSGGEGARGVGTKVLKLVSSSEVQLLLCATLYGSLTVAFRLLYSQPGPPGATFILFLFFYFFPQPTRPAKLIYFIFLANPAC